MILATVLFLALACMAFARRGEGCEPQTTERPSNES